MTTLFEKIIAREIPADILYEDEHCIAFPDIAAQAPTHLLLVPKKPIAKLSDATEEDKILLGHLMTKVSVVMEKVAPGEDFRVVINNGVGASQSIFHLHLHLLAGRPMVWPPG